VEISMTTTFTNAETRALATAAACDAGNASARRAGRAAWCAEDLATAIDMQSRVMGTLGHQAVANLQARIGIVLRGFRRAVWSMFRRHKS
jgi:hypothetical protein